MKFDGAPWKNYDFSKFNMKIQAKPLKSIKFGGLEQDLYEKPCKTMKIHDDLYENPCKTMNIHLDLYENLCKTIKIIEIQWKTMFLNKIYMKIHAKPWKSMKFEAQGYPGLYRGDARAPTTGFRVYILYMQISQEHQWDAAPMYGKPDGYNIELCDWLDLLVIGLWFVAR
jgi:hypothetical protein